MSPRRGGQHREATRLDLAPPHRRLLAISYQFGQERLEMESLLRVRKGKALPGPPPLVESQRFLQLGAGAGTIAPRIR